MDVTLYTRAGCHLCDEVKATLTRARAHAEFNLREVDIDSDPDLRARYDLEVPVVVIDGKKAFKYSLTESDFLKVLNSR
ncbi:MAG: glutaredoxin family protein [Acidobacteriota bacterium]|nr:glutaredoxin family protein [Acidobacteriota bacterium]